MNADGREQRNLSRHPARDWFPAWSSSGKIAFESQRDGNWESMSRTPTAVAWLT